MLYTKGDVVMRSCMLSNVAKNYISDYYCILDNMIEKMTRAKLSDSISGNFIVQMIPHHMAAVEMSENILRYTTLVPLQCIAENIVSAQKLGIEEMSRIQDKCGEMCGPKCDVCLYQRDTDRIIHNMFEKMRSAYGDNNINCNFMREMIPHHMGAVRMAENALKYNVCQPLVPILKDIVAEQKKGICEMKNLMRKIGSVC